LLRENTRYCGARDGALNTVTVPPHLQTATPKLHRKLELGSVGAEIWRRAINPPSQRPPFISKEFFKA